MAYADTADIEEPEVDPSADAEAEATESPAQKLQNILASDNLAATLDDDVLSEMSHKALEGYHIDDQSRAEWKERTDEAMQLAMLIGGEKNYPFAMASNIKNPLLTTAALQFNSRAYPAIVQGSNVAKCKVNGHDPDGSKVQRGSRVGDHLSWQLTSEMPEWESDTDRLTMILPITGCVFRKVYYDPTLGRKCSRLVTPDRMVINYYARSLKDVPRTSEEMYLYPYEIEERIRDKRFIDFEYGDAPADEETGQTDDQAPHKFIEQHRLWDLDGDGYAEPYIVTIHLETEKVCRIVPNFTADTVRVRDDGTVAAIRKQDYYVQYPFMQSPDGGIYGMGLGWLLKDTTEAINTTMNQMLDAGHLSNTQGGFINSGAGIREKKFSFAMGEFKVVTTSMKLQDAILPLPFQGPSPVLFQLLGMLIEMGKEVSSTKDVMTGDTGGKTMQPTTVLALIEQGMKVFNAIFKRIHRAVKTELDLHVRLNYEHLTPEDYNKFFDGPAQYDPKADYNPDDMNISPVSDPTVSTQMQALAKAQVAREIAGPVGSKPYINYPELDKRALAAAEIEDIEKLFVPPPKPDPAQAAFMEAMQKMTLLDLKTKIERMESQSVKDTSSALLDIANAEAAEVGQSLSFYDQYLRTLQAEHGMEMDQNAQVPGGPGQLPAMEGGAPGNPMGGGAPPAAGQGVGGPAPAGAMGPADMAPTGPVAAPPAPSAPAGAM